MNQKTLESKKELVSKLADSISESKSMVVVEYRGLTVAELSSLRKALKAVDATMSVYKNTLFSRACDKVEKSELHQYLTGSNAYVFCSDISAAPKVLTKFAKKNKKLVIKAGLVEGTVMDAEGVKEVANLPGREGLISMFLSCLQAPIRSFACTVQAVADSKN